LFIYTGSGVLFAKNPTKNQGFQISPDCSGYAIEALASVVWL